MGVVSYAFLKHFMRRYWQSELLISVPQWLIVVF